VPKCNLSFWTHVSVPTTSVWYAHSRIFGVFHLNVSTNRPEEVSTPRPQQFISLSTSYFSFTFNVQICRVFRFKCDRWPTAATELFPWGRRRILKGRIPVTISCMSRPRRTFFQTVTRSSATFDYRNRKTNRTVRNSQIQQRPRISTPLY